MRVQVLVRKRRLFVRVFPLLGEMLKDVPKVGMSRVEKFSPDVYLMPCRIREP